jgi:hypothetical protein
LSLRQYADVIEMSPKVGFEPKDLIIKEESLSEEAVELVLNRNLIREEINSASNYL